MIVYLAEIAIPHFKFHKMKNYMSAMSIFCKQEIDNAKLQINCWDEFLAGIRKIELK